MGISWFILAGLALSLLTFFFVFRIKVKSMNINKRDNFLEEFEKLKEELLRKNPDFEITAYQPINIYGEVKGGIFSIEIEQKKYNLKTDLKNILIKDNEIDNKLTVRTNNLLQSAAALNYSIRKVFYEIYNDSVNIEIDDQSMKISCNDGFLLINKKIYNAFFKYRKRFNSPELTDKYIKENILTDPDEDVRINNMQLLLKTENFKPDKDFFKKLIYDNNVYIRLMALTAMQDECINDIITLLYNSDDKVFSVLLKNLLRWKVNKKITIQLYNIITGLNNENKIVNLLEYFVKKKDHDSADYVLEFIKKNTNMVESNYTVLMKLIYYFKKLKIKKSYKWMVEYLDSDDEIKLEVIDALMNIGDIRAVEYLLPLTKGIQFPDIKAAAKKAVDYLQKNVDISDIGTLTLMESESGNLSIDESGNNGKLSIEE